MRRHGDAAVSSHEPPLQRSTIDEERRALSLLSNALRGIEPTNDNDLQDRLGNYYEKYQWCRTWIAKGAKLTGLALKDDAIYREWRGLDRDFLRELRRLSGPQGFDHLRTKIVGVGWGENVTAELDGISSNGSARDDPVGLKISISSVIFDPSGPTEFYVSFTLSNTGAPSIIKNFSVSATRYGRAVLDKLPPRVTFPPIVPAFTGKLVPGENLSTKPLESGGERELRFTFTLAGDAKRDLGNSGTLFRLIGFDIRGNEIAGEYMIP